MRGVIFAAVLYIAVKSKAADYALKRKVMKFYEIFAGGRKSRSFKGI